jgi:hypothetical protein
MEETFLKAVASGLKLDAAKFFADFKNGDDWKPETEIAEQLADFISDKVKAANETARKTGRSESSGKVARLIKSSGFENPDGLQGDELLKSFLEWKDEQSQHIEGDPAKLSKEELLKVPLVQAIVKEVKGKEAERFTAEKSEWEKKVKAAENTRKGMLIEKNLLSILEKGKVNLGDTPEQKSVRLDFLKSRVNLDRVEIGDGDALKFLDESGYESDFEKEVLPIAQTAFGIVTQDKNKGGSGAQGSGTAGADRKDKSWHITPATTLRELDAQVLAADPKDRADIKRAWNEQQKQAAG